MVVDGEAASASSSSEAEPVPPGGVSAAGVAALASSVRWVRLAAAVAADSLHYRTLDGLQRAMGRPADGYCRACFTGEYPIPVPDASGKERFEAATR